MFGIGIVEVFLVLLVALIVIGPDRIPEAAEGLGKTVRAIKQFVNEIKGGVSGESDDIFPTPELHDNDRQK